MRRRLPAMKTDSNPTRYPACQTPRKRNVAVCVELSVI